jgi:prepilin signal peptidase PulO-like enzyme (type II secretory pathway)
VLVSAGSNPSLFLRPWRPVQSKRSVRLSWIKVRALRTTGACQEGLTYAVALHLVGFAGRHKDSPYTVLSKNLSSTATRLGPRSDTQLVGQQYAWLSTYFVLSWLHVGGGRPCLDEILASFFTSSIATDVIYPSTIPSWPLSLNHLQCVPVWGFVRPLFHLFSYLGQASLWILEHATTLHNLLRSGLPVLQLCHASLACTGCSSAYPSQLSPLDLL